MARPGYPTLYKNEYDDIAYEFLASGKSIVQLSKKLGVCRDTIYKWERANDSFKEALIIGREHSQAYWEDELESMMYNKEVNTGLVKLYFANRFKWLDRPEEQEGPKEQPVTRIEVVTVGANSKD